MMERISLQVWLALFGLGLALWLAATYLQDIMAVGLVLFGAILLNLILQPLANRLSYYHIPRGITVFAAYIAGVALLVGLGYLLAPIINQEAAYLQTNGSTLLQAALTRLTNTPLASWIPSWDTLAQNLTQRLDTIITGAASTLAGVSNLILDLSVVFILAYFLTAHENHWSERMIITWFPLSQQNHVREILNNTRNRLERWVLAQLAVALFFMVTFSIGLTLLGTPFALTIGIVSGLLCLIPIPYLGAFIATILTAVSAATGNPWQILWVAIYTLLVSAFEAHILLPILYGRAVGLDSAVVLLALLAGAKIGGIIGVFFAVPAAVITLTIVQEIQTATVGKTVVEQEKL
jgi:predicted PurR-regulated permease PerM